MFPDMDDAMVFSSEELTWLQASEILEAPPALPPKDIDVFTQDSSSRTYSSSSSSSHLEYNLKPPPPPSSPRHIPSPKRRSNTFTTPPRNLSRVADSPRSEWIYRRPKSPVTIRTSGAGSSSSSPRARPRPRPSTGYQTPTVSSLSRTVPSTHPRRAYSAVPAHSFESNGTSAASSSTGPLWSTILRPRSRSERSIPLLKTIPSQSQLSLTRPDMPDTSSRPSLPSTPKRAISSPRAMHARPPSISSTLSSISSPSPSPSSSRSESPITPLSSSPCGPGSSSLFHRRHPPYHQRHRTSPSAEGDALISSSCPPPSKSILTRTSSVSTKDSSHTSHTVNKSVKFAAVPIVHYASTGYWDVEAVDAFGDSSMGINVDGMDIDEDPFANYGARYVHPRPPSRERENMVHRLDAAKLRELQCATPTPERERERARGLKRLMSLNRKPAPTTTTNTSVATAVKSSPSSAPSSPSAPRAASARPVISTPYALGGHPPPPMQSTASLRATSQRARKYPSRLNKAADDNGAAGSVPDLLLDGGSVPLRSAPSMESFRSSKSTAARSVRSLSGSVKSASSTRGFRAWFERTMGWTDP